MAEKELRKKEKKIEKLKEEIEQLKKEKNKIKNEIKDLKKEKKSKEEKIESCINCYEIEVKNYEKTIESWNILKQKITFLIEILNNYTKSKKLEKIEKECENLILNKNIKEIKNCIQIILESQQELNKKISVLLDL